ncbi:MAG: mannose-1-phosphate guanylyltransferase [Syntrophomonadaceae bacterium]|jgi:mannose-1-phosphate guanylyltransferase/mannose-6-phosphate isomerase
MIAVILAGGKGLRLWPESRRNRPKQLCQLVDNKCMLDHTIDRLMAAGAQHILVVTGDNLLSQVQETIAQRPDAAQIEVIGEPEGKNTAPAVGLALSRHLSDQEDPIIGVFPADHHVLDVQNFGRSIAQAETAAENGLIATIGITPKKPETGYGYIEKTRWEFAHIPGVYQVNSFCEKPDLNTAQSYIKTGQHMWNSGIYMGRVSTFLEEFAEHLPEIYEHLTKGFDAYLNSYSLLPSISLDYGIAEKSSRMAVVPADFGWLDLGSWDALAELFEKDQSSNVAVGKDIMVLNSQNCVVKQKDKTVVLYGLKNILVVETDDVIMISDRNKCQDVRKVVEALRQNNRDDLL